MKSVSSRNICAPSKVWKLIGFVSFLILIVQIPSSEEAGKMFSNLAPMIIIKWFCIASYSSLSLVTLIFANVIRIRVYHRREKSWMWSLI